MEIFFNIKVLFFLLFLFFKWYDVPLADYISSKGRGKKIKGVFLSVGLKMQISSLSAANVQTVWAGRNAACWHLLLAAGFCHMMVENKKNRGRRSRAAQTLTLAVSTTTGWLVGVISIKSCASCASARKRASAASPLCLLESWLRHGTALRGYRKKETDWEVNKPARGPTRGF